MSVVRSIGGAVLACLGVASALGDDDTPVATHRVTAEAKAAIERFERLVYSPAAHGVTSLSGRIIALGVGAPVRASFGLQPDGGVSVTEGETLARRLRESGLDSGLLLDPLSNWFQMAQLLRWEADCELRRGAAETTIVFTTEADGKGGATRWFLLDERGLVTRLRKRGLSNSRRDSEVAYTWKLVGDLYRIDAVDFAGPDLKHYLASYGYTDVAGADVLTSYAVTCPPQDGGDARTIRFFIEDLDVNGAKVDLPKPWGHVNRVTPEARTAIDVCLAIVDRPTAHGIRTLVADIQLDGADQLGRVELVTPTRPVIRLAQEAENPRSKWADVKSFVPTCCTLALDGLRFILLDEFDAEVVVEGDRRKLVVTGFADGVPTTRAEHVLDARGVPTSTRLHSLDAGAEADQIISYSWTDLGGRHRLAALHWRNDEPSRDASRVDVAIDYADVGGLSVPCVYELSFFSKKSSESATWRLADLVVDGRRAALPNPKAKPNVVSPEAAMALKELDALVDRAARHGLVTASGVIEPTGLKFVVTAPARVTFPYADDVRPGSAKAQVAGALIWPLSLALGGVSPVEGVEFDAKFEQRGNGRVLVVSNREDGEVAGVFESELDEVGLPTAMLARGAGESGAATEYRYEWERSGTGWRPAVIEIWDAKAAAPVKVTWTYRYRNGTAWRLPTSIHSHTSGGPLGDTAATYSVEFLEVNGQKLERAPPSPAHRNEITAEARAVMDRYERVAYRPCARGLVSASGRVVTAAVGVPDVVFQFSAPNLLTLKTSRDDVDPASGSLAVQASHLPLIVILDGLRLAESPEFDAKMVERDGVRRLVVTELQQGKHSATAEFTFDADGLVTSLRRRDGPDAAAPTSDVQFRLEWAPVGDARRVRAVDLVVELDGVTTSVRYEIAVARVDGVEVPSSFVRRSKQGDAPEQIGAMRVEDLVVNGRKAAAPEAGRAR